MKSSEELKVISKQGLKGKYGQAIGAMLLTYVVSGVPLCSPAMNVGYAKYNTLLVRKQTTSPGDVFDGFDVFGKALWLTIITGFFTALWSILLVIPGLVKSLA